MAEERPEKHGLLLVDKPAGCTSHDVVARARKLLKTKKIGHCGTLDPDATGLLLLTVGRATRLTRFLIRAPKVYEGTLRFGVQTDTYDLAGEVVAERPLAGLDPARVEQEMERFVGVIQQAPPPYCAKKVQGVRYYELARRGEPVPESSKEVTIYEFSPLRPWAPGEDLAFRLGCSSGTYARSLAHDLGQALGCGAALSSLRRVQVASFRLEEAPTLDELAAQTADGGTPARGFIPFDDIPLPFHEIVTDAQQERRIHQGQTVLVRGLDGQEGDWIKVRNQRQQFIAVGAVVERIGTGNVGVVQPKVVFH